jgi:hypothetical protein
MPEYAKWRETPQEKAKLKKDLIAKLKKLNITNPQIINYYTKRRSNG